MVQYKIQTGESVVNQLGQRVARVESIGRSIAILAETLPADDTITRRFGGSGLGLADPGSIAR